MPIKAGYLVDLSKVTLNETDSTSWIQAMPVGTYSHPVFGEIDLTPERINHFAENIKNNVRTSQLDIDYDHKEYSGEAAGWVSAAEARPDGLWVLVEWTKKAFTLLKEKAYRYFSPEFADEWTHPKTGQTYTDVMFGGGITNRPFLKDILPINLSEAFAEGGATSNGGKEMTPEQLAALAKSLGLPEDATAEQVVEAAQAKAAEDEGTEEEHEEEQTEVDLSEKLPEDLKKLSETNPTIKRLAEIIETQGQQIQRATKSLRESAVGTQVRTFSDKAKAKGYDVPAVLSEKLTNVLIKLNEKSAEEVAKLFGDLMDIQLVKLGENGYQRTGGDRTGVQKFTEAVAALQASDKMSYAEAVNEIARRDPELFNEYRSESYAG